MTDEVIDRMKNLCGATNYSLALRNCEHAARWVYLGYLALAHCLGLHLGPAKPDHTH